MITTSAIETATVVATSAIVYTSTHCVWCKRVKRLLEENGYEVKEISVSSTDDNTIIEDFQNKYNQTLKTVPQVVIDGQYVGGYTEVHRWINSRINAN